MVKMRGASIAVLAILTAASVSACSHRRGGEGVFVSQESGGFKPFGIGKRRGPSGPTATLGVNGYLWRATLDTLSFMPLATADPWGGTVITEWYSNPEKPDERFKATVYILDTRLRADGLKVTVFKQAKDAGGNWVDAETSAQTETDIENAILTRARQLRLSNISGKG